MGVQGFETFIQATSNEYQWKSRNNLRELTNKSLVVDGGSFLHYILLKCGPSFYLYGFDPSGLIKEINSFLHTLINQLNIRLVVMLDGVSTAGKEQSLHLRHAQRRKLISGLFNVTNISERLRAAYDTQQRRFHTFSIPMARQLFAQCLNTYSDQIGSEKLTVIQLLHEADLEVAKYCVQNDLYGVLASDSDYYIFNVPHYIPFNELTFEDDTVYASVYVTANIAQVLSSVKPFHENLVIRRQIDIRLLCDWSCLVGNDFFNMKTVYERIKEYLLQVTSQSCKQQMQNMSKPELVALFLMTHPDLTLTDEGYLDYSEDKFCEYIFTQKVIRSGHHKAFLQDYIAARKIYESLFNVDINQRYVVPDVTEPVLMELGLANEFQRKNGVFTPELLSALLKRYISFPVAIEPSDSTILAYLAPFRRALYSLLFSTTLSNAEDSKTLYIVEVIASDEQHSQAVVNSFSVYTDGTKLSKFYDLFSLKSILQILQQKPGKFKKASSIAEANNFEFRPSSLDFPLQLCDKSIPIQSLNRIFIDVMAPSIGYVSDLDELRVTLGVLLFNHYIEPHLVNKYSNLLNAKAQINRTLILCVLNQQYVTQHGDFLNFEHDIGIAVDTVDDLTDEMVCAIHSISGYITAVSHVVSLFDIFKLPQNLLNTCFNGRIISIVSAQESTFKIVLNNLLKALNSDQCPKIVQELLRASC